MIVHSSSADTYQKMLNHLYARAMASRGNLNANEQQANLSLFDLIIILKQEALLLLISIENITQDDGLRFLLFAIHTGDKKWVEFVWNVFASRIDINRNKGCNVIFLNERYLIQNQRYFYTSNFVNPLSQACHQGFVDIVEFLLKKNCKLSDKFRQNIFNNLEKINPISAAKILFHLLEAGEISPNLLEPFDFSLDFDRVSRIKNMFKTQAALLHMIIIANVELEFTSSFRSMDKVVLELASSCRHKNDIDNFKRILLTNNNSQIKIKELSDWLCLPKQSGQSMISTQSSLSRRISFLSNIALQMFKYISENHINYFSDWNEWIAIRYHDYLQAPITENRSLRL